MKTESITGHLILLSAPSGSGKNTVMEGLGELSDQLYFLKTYTTRERRKGASENPKYDFITVEEFKQMIEDEAFIEWAEFGGNYYATGKEEIQSALYSGKIAFKEMELQGVHQIRNFVPKEHLTVIYLDAGGWNALERRIKARAPITEEELEMRHQRFKIESAAKSEADVIIDNFDNDVAEAQKNFRAVIEKIVTKYQK